VLTQYLEKQRPTNFFVENLAIDPSLLTRGEEYYSWLVTYTAVETRDADEKNKKVADYIAKIDNLVYKSALFFYTTGKVCDKFTTGELLELKRALVGRLVDLDKVPGSFTSEMRAAGDVERKIIQVGLYKLNNVLKHRAYIKAINN
jgi:hypothetical protein